MAFELPSDLINRLKKATRAEAGLSDDVLTNNDNHIPPLPSLSEAVASSDPSPPYLRCKNCNGRLLRGVESLFCIYCGRPTDFDHPPISFKDTIAYSWLLQSLDLDGSEMVTPPMERSESTLGPNASKEEIPLSDLLNFKIQWPTEVEKKTYGSSDKESEKRISINFTGVDLDNFFSKSKWEDFSGTPEESSLTRENEEVSESQVDASHHTVNLFESVQPSESTIPSSDEKGGNSFSGWEADFQADSATDNVTSLDHSGHHQEPSKLSDPVSRTGQGVSSEVNSTFAASEYFKEDEGKTDSAALPSSGEWISEDLWANMNSTIPQQTPQPGENVPANDSTTQDIFSNLAMGNNLFQVDQLPFDDPCTSTTSRAENHADMLDDWNDFSCSAGVQASSQNSTTGSHSQPFDFLGEISNPSLFSTGKDFKEMDLSSFSQLEPVSTSVIRETSQKMDSSPLEVSYLDRIFSYGSEAVDRASQPATEKEAKNPSNEQNKDVEVVISKMHDLSFMLENKLSVPPKSDGPSFLQ